MHDQPTILQQRYRSICPLFRRTVRACWTRFSRLQRPPSRPLRRSPPSCTLAVRLPNKKQQQTASHATACALTFTRQPTAIGRPATSWRTSRPSSPVVPSRSPRRPSSIASIERTSFFHRFPSIHPFPATTTGGRSSASPTTPPPRRPSPRSSSPSRCATRSSHCPVIPPATAATSPTCLTRCGGHGRPTRRLTNSCEVPPGPTSTTLPASLAR
mmetsp:Transcript_8627/g.27513  ORF Transcript_8627/g.27513 Transcript_8627/m.27513 type:complete len:214 (-) Transcript_8627:2018-2659(-)